MSTVCYTSAVCDHDSRSDFRYRCSETLERFGDEAMDRRRHEEALKHYSAALSIHPVNTARFFILRSKVCMKKGLWEDALGDANRVSSIVSRQSLHIEAE